MKIWRNYALKKKAHPFNGEPYKRHPAVDDEEVKHDLLPFQKKSDFVPQGLK
jgi:hypothetical protein